MKEKNNRKAKYYSTVGSYGGSHDGTIKIAGWWVRAVELNRINKSDWVRWQGPPSKAIVRAMRTGNPRRADLLFPERALHENEKGSARKTRIYRNTKLVENSRDCHLCLLSLLQQLISKRKRKRKHSGINR
jgi:hypothetical protein